MAQRLIQTFWTAPMGDPYLHMRMAYASAKSQKEQGYSLAMFTDEGGYKLLSGFPYDEIKVVDMPVDVNPGMFAAIKYYALKDEPLGVIHVDYDVIIDQPCLTPSTPWDVFTQMRYTGVCKHEIQRKFLNENGYPTMMAKIPLSEHPYCTGVIGFGNEQLKQQFINNYLEAVEIYKDKQINCCVDLLFEQVFIASLVETYGYTPVFITEEKCHYKYPISNKPSVRYFQNEAVGFTHYHAQSKWTQPIQNEISKRLTKEDFKIINQNYICYGKTH